MNRRLIFIILLVGAGLGTAARGTEVMPPPPTAYVSDEAAVLNNAGALNAELEQFERATSNQLLVAIYPSMQTDSSIEDYTVRIANSWKAGRKGLDNGAILFVFVQQRKMFIQVGYGLEGALPDARCKEIIEQKIKPYFKDGDYSGGVAAGVDAMMAAARGEYKGNGKTVGDSRGAGNPGSSIVPVIFLIVVIWFIISRLRRATIYGSGGSSAGWFWAGMLANSLSQPGRGGFGGGEGGGFGGGGFSGGGGSFGGGGAGGSW